MIRVNSQSGKAGVTALLDQALSVKLPREVQTEFYKIVQKEAERTGKEVSIRTIVRLFRQTYRLGIEQPLPGYVTLHSYRIVNDHHTTSTQSQGPEVVTVEADIQCDGSSRTIRGSGPTPQKAFLSALAQTLSVPMTLLDGQEHELETKSRQERPMLSSSSFKTNEYQRGVASFAKISIPISMQQTFWGIGAADDRSEAGIRAVVSAVNLGMDQLRQASLDKMVYPRIKSSPRGQKLMMMA